MIVNGVSVTDDGALAVAVAGGQHVIPAEAVGAYSLLLGVSEADAVAAILATSQTAQPPDWASVYAECGLPQTGAADSALSHLGVTRGDGVGPIAAASQPAEGTVDGVAVVLGAHGAPAGKGAPEVAAMVVANDILAGVADYITGHAGRIAAVKEQAQKGAAT